MGNLPLSTGLFHTGGTPEPVSEGHIITRRISSGVTYHYAPSAGVGDNGHNTSSSAKDSTLLPSHCPLSDSSPLLSHAITPASLHASPGSESDPLSRPLLVFFAWLGAKQGAVAKYRDLYLDRGMDVLVVRSSVMHFLWPRWGLDYGLEVLKVLERPEFARRTVLVHASSIGGYTFTQILTHVAWATSKQAGLAQRVTGQIYDSLVVGSLEHMAIGLGKTLAPRFESFVKNAAMFYFWLLKKHTADFYNNGIQVFYNSPITAPALFFFSENDALCDQADMEQCIDHWRKRGVTVEGRKWKESIHAAHLRCHPEDYLLTLEKFLKSLAIPSVKE